MDSPVTSAPLTLLISEVASEVGARLRSLIQESDMFVSAHAAAHNASSFDIVYQGVSLHVGVVPQVEGWRAAKKIFCNLDAMSVWSGITISLGEHVAGGERVPAILRALLGAAQQLGVSLNAVGVLWHPAEILSGFAYFSEAVTDYRNGGAFPVLAMVNFRAETNAVINSNGLAFLAGQELQVHTKDMDQSETMRRVVRVVHNIAVNGPILEAVKLNGVEQDEILEIEPNADASVLKMNTYSRLDM